MFNLETYIQNLISECKTAFNTRLLYMGLQGSYLRDEAHENSDIDIMVIIDNFTVTDMQTYRKILQKIGWFEKSCGFICGKTEILNWNPMEVCQLKFTTKDILGTLIDYLPPATRQDEINYVKISLGNLYHELCHRFIHADREKNNAKFRGTCKGFFFLIQNLYYLESGNFILSKKELKEKVAAADRRILEFSDLPDDYNFDEAFSELISWCQNAFVRLSLTIEVQSRAE